MARLTYKARKRWAIIILLVGLPIYVVAAVTTMNWLYPDPSARAPILIELAVYIGLGVLWAFPFKGIFRGIGQADPDAPRDED